MEPMTAEERLLEWGKSLHREPWNYWPSVSVLGRIKDEGAGASQETAGDRDGGLGALIDRLAPREGREFDVIARDRRCAEVWEAYYAMEDRFRGIVDATYRCAGIRETPRSWEGAVEIAACSSATYFRRKREMLDWLTGYLCLPKASEKAA